MKSVVVGTAGHIDHGKSALVLALTGTDPDRLKEEKARGITIDLGFAHLVTQDVDVAFVDVPGHERFVKNMLAGVGGIDLVVLVVAADESVMPQTREHFDICRLLQIPSGLVVLTKADLADSETLALVRLDVSELVAGSFLEGAPVIPVSAKSGDGLDALRAALLQAARQSRGRSASGVARLPIDRVFSMKGFGTVVTGTLVSGSLAVDDDLEVAPGRRRVKVRGLQVHGQACSAAHAGQRTAVNVAGVEVDDLARGQSLVAPGGFEETRVADAVVEVLRSAKPLKHGARVRFHQGTAEILGRVAIVGPAGQGAGAPVALPGSRAFVRLRLEAPAVLARGDRYILRAYSPSVTIAGGVILDPRPPRLALRSPATLDRSRRLEPAGEVRESELRAAAVMLEDAGKQGLALSALVSRAGIEPRSIDDRVKALIAGGQAERAGPVLVAATILRRLKEAIPAALSAHHKQEPLSEGVPREELRESVFARGNPAVFERALVDLTAAGTIAVRDRVALAGHRVALSPEEQRALSDIERAVRKGGLTPPDARAAAIEAGTRAALADRMVGLLQRQKVLVKVDALLFHEAALNELKVALAALKAEGVTRIDVAMFKERFGVTRKFAIPLLEYLDRQRVTRRVGDARILL